MAEDCFPECSQAPPDALARQPRSSAWGPTYTEVRVVARQPPPYCPSPGIASLGAVSGIKATQCSNCAPSRRTDYPLSSSCSAKQPPGPSHATPRRSTESATRTEDCLPSKRPPAPPVMPSVSKVPGRMNTDAPCA